MPPVEYAYGGRILHGRDIVELSTVVYVPPEIVALARRDDPLPEETK